MIAFGKGDEFFFKTKKKRSRDELKVIICRPMLLNNISIWKHEWNFTQLYTQFLTFNIIPIGAGIQFQHPVYKYSSDQFEIKYKVNISIEKLNRWKNAKRKESQHTSDMCGIKNCKMFGISPVPNIYKTLFLYFVYNRYLPFNAM